MAHFRGGRRGRSHVRRGTPDPADGPTEGLPLSDDAPREPRASAATFCPDSASRLSASLPSRAKPGRRESSTGFAGCGQDASGRHGSASSNSRRRWAQIGQDEQDEQDQRDQSAIAGSSDEDLVLILNIVFILSKAGFFWKGWSRAPLIYARRAKSGRNGPFWQVVTEDRGDGPARPQVEGP